MISHRSGETENTIIADLPVALGVEQIKTGAIVTNSGELRLVLQKRGYLFETDTDTEAVAKLTKYIYDSQSDKRITFTELVKTVLKELEGSFAFVFKSIHYPNEVVTARRGSPLLIGVKTDKKLKVDFGDVEFAGQENDAKMCPRRPRALCWRRRPSAQISAHSVASLHVRGWPSNSISPRTSVWRPRCAVEGAGTAGRGETCADREQGGGGADARDRRRRTAGPA
ncbi:hypothetical protein B0H14DRAFT_2934117, partial [Mycena olivaceomarginata]